MAKFTLTNNFQNMEYAITCLKKISYSFTDMIESAIRDRDFDHDDDELISPDELDYPKDLEELYDLLEHNIPDDDDDIDILSTPYLSWVDDDCDTQSVIYSTQSGTNTYKFICDKPTDADSSVCVQWEVNSTTLSSVKKAIKCGWRVWKGVEFCTNEMVSGDVLMTRMSINTIDRVYKYAINNNRSMLLIDTSNGKLITTSRYGTDTSIDVSGYVWKTFVADEEFFIDKKRQEAEIYYNGLCRNAIGSILLINHFAEYIYQRRIFDMPVEYYQGWYERENQYQIVDMSIFDNTDSPSEINIYPKYVCDEDDDSLRISR